MGTVTILPETTQDPISLIGRRAGICWGSDISEPSKNYKRGLDCINSDHGRALEFVNIEVVLSGYSARVIREWYTHIGGAPTRLQASTRYIDYSEFGYVTPKSIENNAVAKDDYQLCIMRIQRELQHLADAGIPREDLAMLLPLAMTTKVVDKRNLRNLIDMSRQRMCSRANWEYRQLFTDVCNALCDVSNEWKQIIKTQMKPKCEHLGYCPEKHGCGKYPGRIEQDT